MNVSAHVVENHLLPVTALKGVWNGIIVDEAAVKQPLLQMIALSLEVRRRVPRTVSALHGLILVSGPPGTGKTTLARSVGQELAGIVRGGHIRLIRVDPHGVMSAEHGVSQRSVMTLLSEHVPGLAADERPTILLIDEIESMAVARSAASLAANPVDVHRATDAVLTALDRNADTAPHIITVVTSNFTKTLDQAFISRADLTIEVPLPSAGAIEAILKATLIGFAAAYPQLEGLAESPALRKVAAALVGCDGRQVRKFITAAMAAEMDTSIEPGALAIEQLLREARASAAKRRGADDAAA